MPLTPEEELELIEIEIAIKEKETAGQPSMADNVQAASNPMEMLKTVSPSNVGKLTGVAAANAPDATNLAINAIPGMGNPMQIAPALSGAMKNLDDLGTALKRTIMVQGGAELAPKEVIPARAGQAAGTAVEMVMPAQVLKESSIGKALTPGGKASVGKAIGEAEKLAGVSETVPTVANYAKKLNLPTRERSFTDIVNSVKGKLEKGEKLHPQDLVDFKELVRQQYGAEKIAKGSKLDAMTAKSNKMAESELNKLVSGREPLSKKYGEIKSIQEKLKVLAKAGAGASGLGLAGVLLKKLAGVKK